MNPIRPFKIYCDKCCTKGQTSFWRAEASLTARSRFSWATRKKAPSRALIDHGPAIHRVQQLFEQRAVEGTASFLATSEVSAGSRFALRTSQQHGRFPLNC